MIQSDLYSDTKRVSGNEIFATSMNNVVIPQNDLPLLVAEMDSIALIAKARRIAIYYSQMAA